MHVSVPFVLIGSPQDCSLGDFPDSLASEQVPQPTRTSGRTLNVDWSFVCPLD